jgi:hypothetical protein
MGYSLASNTWQTRTDYYTARMRAVRLAVSFAQASTYMSFHVFAETYSFHTLKSQPIPVQSVHYSPILPRSPAGHS